MHEKDCVMNPSDTKWHKMGSVSILSDPYFVYLEINHEAMKGVDY